MLKYYCRLAIEEVTTGGTSTMSKTTVLEASTGESRFFSPFDIQNPPTVANDNLAVALVGCNFPPEAIITLVDLEYGGLPEAVLDLMKATGLVATTVGIRAFHGDDSKLIVIALLRDTVLAVGQGVTEQIICRVREADVDCFRVEGKVPAARCLITSFYALAAFIQAVRNVDSFPLFPLPVETLRPLALVALGFEKRADT